MWIVWVERNKEEFKGQIPPVHQNLKLQFKPANEILDGRSKI